MNDAPPERAKECLIACLEGRTIGAGTVHQDYAGRIDDGSGPSAAPLSPDTDRGTASSPT